MESRVPTIQQKLVIRADFPFRRARRECNEVLISLPSSMAVRRTPAASTWLLFIVCRFIPYLSHMH
jgi:hypothetical protein